MVDVRWLSAGCWVHYKKRVADVTKKGYGNHVKAPKFPFDAVSRGADPTPVAVAYAGVSKGTVVVMTRSLPDRLAEYNAASAAASACKRAVSGS